MGGGTRVDVRWASPGPATVAIESFLDRADADGPRSIVVPSAYVRDRLAPAVPPECDVTDVDSIARERLDAGGWTVPEPLAHADRSIGGVGEPRDRAEAWLAALLDERPAYRHDLAVVESPRSLVTTFERLVADGIVPTSDGWAGDGRRRLIGDADALEDRLSTLGERVPGLDADGLRSAFDADRSAIEAFAHDVLVHYLGWCLDLGLVSRAQRLAYASWQAGGDPVEDHIVGMTGAVPRVSHLDLMATRPADGITILVDILPTTGGDHVWMPPAATRHDRLVAHFDERSIAVESASDGGPRTRLDRADRGVARSWHASGEDPDATALDVLKGILSTGLGALDPPSPDEVLLVTDSRTGARRVLRLASDRSLSLGRTGRVAVHRSPVGVLSLAWLRIVTGHDATRGWAVVLEQAGCTRGDLQAWLDTEDKPAALAAFRSDLKRLDDGLAIVDAVAGRYDLDARSSATLIDAIGSSLRARPTPFAVLDRLERGFANHTLATLEPAGAQVVDVIAEADLVDQRPSVIVHLADGGTPGRGPLTYAPPLGLRWTETAVEVGEHLVERSDAGWEALGCLRTDRATRRRTTERLRGHARDGVVFVGRRPPGLDLDPMR